MLSIGPLGWALQWTGFGRKQALLNLFRLAGHPFYGGRRWAVDTAVLRLPRASLFDGPVR